MRLPCLVPDWHSYACVYGNVRTHANAYLSGNATPGPSGLSPHQGPPTSRGTTPTGPARGTTPMSRLTPVTEEAAFGQHSDTGAARKAWDPTHLDAQVERQVKIRACLDLTTVLNTVPSAYRGVLSDLFARYMHKVEQRDQLTRARSKLEGLKAKKEFPYSYNSLKLPTIQYQGGMRDLWNENWNLPAQNDLTILKQRLLDTEIAFVKKEQERMIELIDERAAVQEAWKSLDEAFKRRDPGDMYFVQLGTDWEMEGTEISMVQSKVNPLRDELRALQVDLPVYFRKVLDLKMDLIERIHGKGAKKAAEKSKVDAEVQDVASSSNKEAVEAINKEVQKQVAAALKAAGVAPAPTSSKQKVRSGAWRSHMNPTHTAAPARRELESQQEETGTNTQGQEEVEEGEEDFVGYGQGGSPGRQEAKTPAWRRKQAESQFFFREQKREAESLVAVLKSKPWTFGVPSSYPDEILTLPHSYQVETLLSRAPVALLDSNRFRSSVHVQPGLDVPLAIQHDLSASLKFMFETKIDKSLIQKAYSDLVRRTRWKWYFLGQGNAHEEYDPDYAVVPRDEDETRRKVPEAAHPHIERGLQAGQDYVSEVMTLLPDADNSRRVPNPLNLKRAREFMVSNNLIVTSTDKNLGVAVFKREWIFSQAVALFGNREDYTPWSPQNATDYLTTMADLIRELCTIHLHDSKQLSTFMSHCIPTPNQVNDWANWVNFVPEAYAIPKIHKNPWKGRPICPGFCLPQNPASKVLAKTVRPFIDQIPWVIQGSKDFVKKLANVRIPQGRKGFIVSADVVAFYPSVDTTKLREILGQFAEHTLVPIDLQKAGDDPTLPSDYAERRLDYYDRLFQIALAPPVMTFNDQILVQQRGLPMGAAGSPDAANIFGYWYEQMWMDQVTSNDDILFYGRYLDDIYCVVVADTPDEARNLLSFVSLGDVNLLWEPPSDKAVFLDLTTWIKDDGSIYHEPFVKAMSHRERIPWSSAHPLDVKRGTFSSEISRLATLCSDKSVYLTQCEEAVNLYIGRGYPPAVVRSWLAKQKEKRWEDRVADKAEDPSGNTFFTLKTHFNEAWNSFNVGELQTRILHHWREFDSDSTLGRRRRGRDSLGDPPPARRVRVTLQGSEFPGQSRLAFVNEADGNRAEVSGLTGVRSGLDAENDRLQVSAWTKEWVDTAKFLVSRRKNTQLWDVTRVWNKTVWDAYLERSGLRRPFDPLYEGLVILNEEDE